MSFATFALALALVQTVPPPTFPEGILGQWTEELSNCGGEDTAGVWIAPDLLAFYEAEGRVQAITIERDGDITARLSFTGEGQSWTETTTMTLSADQASMDVRALGQRFVLLRCPVDSSL